VLPITDEIDAIRSKPGHFFHYFNHSPELVCELLFTSNSKVLNPSERLQSNRCSSTSSPPIAELTVQLGKKTPQTRPQASQNRDSYIELFKTATGAL